MILLNKTNGSRVSINPDKIIMIEESTADNSCIYLSTSDGYMTVYVKESVYTIHQAIKEG